MRVLMVASEAFPLVKTGGLADVAGALPGALAQHGVDARLLLPAYPSALARVAVDEREAIAIGDAFSAGPARLLPFVWEATGLTGWLVDCPPLYERHEGGPYLDAHGHDWPDNHLRFGLLCRAAANIAALPGLVDFDVDVVHCHDWQAGLVPLYLKALAGQQPPTVFTAHNLHFSGRFGPEVVAQLGLPSWCMSVEGAEFYGAMSFLKAGVYYADKITTVSPTYAQEIQTEMGGEGLHGLLQSRAADLHGILNGIDDRAWDPAADPQLALPYDASTVAVGKPHAKAQLQREHGLQQDAAIPLVGMVGRLTWQKGVDLLLHCMPHLLSSGAQLVVLGSGDPGLQSALKSAAAVHSGRVAYVHGYDEGLSHRLIAGCDLLAVPSRFEPCGLTQLYAQRYGTLPIVRATGGLADTVVDADADPDGGTGFSFQLPEVHALADAINRALACYRDGPRYAQVVQRAMALDRGWAGAAAPYAQLYAALVGGA